MTTFIIGAVVGVVVYYCIRDTGNPVYNNFSDLIDIYLEVAH